MLNQFLALMPEIMVIFFALSIQIFAVFFKHMVKTLHAMSILGLIAIILCITYFSMTLDSFDNGINIFDEAMRVSKLYWWMKALILSLSLMTIVIYRDYNIIAHSSFKMEFITLILLSTVGVFIAITAQNLLLFFCGLELQSLAGYALAAFNNKNTKSSEAGLKYFILGGLMSAIMLLGMSFIYGFSGSIDFVEIKSVLNHTNGSIGLKIGIILLLAGIFFKLSAAPFHIWTPDVYEGAPIVSVSYFAVAQKIGMFLALMHILDYIYLEHLTSLIFKVVSILSMIIGAVGAIMQTSLKRLLGYSTILNIGYALIGFVSYPSTNAGFAAFIYIFIYAIAALGVFACLVALFGSKVDDVTFTDLSGVASVRKTIAAAISIFMFSMIGLPPFAGFFGKYYLFYNAVLQGELLLALTGVITSVIAAVYYLKIVKYMYFVDVPKGEITEVIPSARGLMLISFFAALFTCLFSILVI